MALKISVVVDDVDLMFSATHPMWFRSFDEAEEFLGKARRAHERAVKLNTDFLPESEQNHE